MTVETLVEKLKRDKEGSKQVESSRGSDAEDAEGVLYLFANFFFFWMIFILGVLIACFYATEPHP